MAVNSRPQPIKKSSDFSRINLKGKRIKLCPWLTLLVHQSEDDKSYFGLTVSRKIGKAVTRNKLKRWVRNCVLKESWPSQFKGKQVVFLFRAQSDDFFKKLEFKEFKRIYFEKILSE